MLGSIVDQKIFDDLTLQYLPTLHAHLIKVGLPIQVYFSLSYHPFVSFVFSCFSNLTRPFASLSLPPPRPLPGLTNYFSFVDPFIAMVYVFVHWLHSLGGTSPLFPPPSLYFHFIFIFLYFRSFMFYVFIFFVGYHARD